MTDQDRKDDAFWVPLWMLSLLSGIAYFAQKRGSLRTPPDDLLDGTFLWMSVLFFLLPLVRSINIGGLVSVERDIKQNASAIERTRSELQSQIVQLVRKR